MECEFTDGVVEEVEFYATLVGKRSSEDGISAVEVWTAFISSVAEVLDQLFYDSAAGRTNLRELGEVCSVLAVVLVFE